MKILSDKTLKNGARRITIELTGDKDTKFMVIKGDAYYRLGGQVEDVMQGYIIIDSNPVYWCSLTQKWEEA